MSRLPESIEDCKPSLINRYFHQYAVYTRQDDDHFEVIVYDTLLSKVASRMTFQGRAMQVLSVSHDGQVVHCGPMAWQSRNIQVIADANGNGRTFAEHLLLSPNGNFGAVLRTRLDLLALWWPSNRGDMAWDIVDWRTGITLASFPGAESIMFSPDNEHLAVMRRDGPCERRGACSSLRWLEPPQPSGRSAGYGRAGAYGDP